MQNLSIFLIGNKVSVFVCSDVRYHKISCSGHHTVIISNAQPFKFAASNLAPITHFSKRSKEPQWHNGHSWTDIAEFGPIPIPFRFTMAQSYREVAIMNQDFIFIGQKWVRSSPLCQLRLCLFQDRWQNWAIWAELDAINLKGCSLFSGIEPWTLH